eukprot:263683_1
MSSSRLISIVMCICTIHQGMAFGLSQYSQQPWSTTRSSSSTVQQASTMPNFSIPNPFESKNARRSQLKKEILGLASETNRGLTATDEEKEEMDQLFKKLEALNPTRNPLILAKNKPSVNGDWSLDYTTSGAILGKGGFPRIGPIIQNIDTTTLSAKNSEVVRYAIIDVPRSIAAELSPVDGKFTNVQFKRFQLGPVGFNAPEKFKGALDITYLDEDVRLTRGDKGNIFVLTRM